MAQPFYHFVTSFSDHAIVYRQLVLLGNESTGFTISFLPILAPPRLIQVIIPSVNEPTGITVLPILALPTGLYSQLVSQSMGLAVLPFYHFLPILAPLQVYTAH